VKKIFFSSLSFFLYLFLLIALGVYIYEHEKKTIKVDESSITTSKPIQKKLPQIPKPKEKDVIDIDFDTRLNELDAKVGDPIFIRIFKKESLLEVWIKPVHEYVLFKKYPICAYSGELGPKLKEGDKQAPEGFYSVKKNQLNPNSAYHLSFNLGFPNKYDRAHKRTGSYLMVHGACVSIGCYAMTDAKIEEIYQLVEEALGSGQKEVQVHAFPFYMSEENMAAHEANEWYGFWTELKEGYEYFEAERLPPHVKIENKRYTIYEANP
jgi:murein L,D-transpeptidase YafK